MDDMMSVTEARDRVALMRTEGESVSFGATALEVTLDGTFDMNDIEALFVLLHSPDFQGEQPLKSGAQHE